VDRQDEHVPVQASCSNRLDRSIGRADHHAGEDLSDRSARRVGAYDQANCRIAASRRLCGGAHRLRFDVGVHASHPRSLGFHRLPETGQIRPPPRSYAELMRQEEARCAEREVVRLVHAGLDWATLSLQVGEVLRRAMPFLSAEVPGHRGGFSGAGSAG
jgi:hypothetical protein